MSAEIDIHSLTNSHSRYGWEKYLTKQCTDCAFSRTIVNHDWAPGHPSIGEVCLWGKNWKWLRKPYNPLRGCSLLSRQPSEETVSRKVVEEEFVSYGIRLESFELGLFSDVLRMYNKTVGGMVLRRGGLEYYYESIVKNLQSTNATDLRLGSFVSGHSKLLIEWRYPEYSSDRLLFFSCYPNTKMSQNQGEYLGSRFELVVVQYLQERGIGVPLSR